MASGSSRLSSIWSISSKILGPTRLGVFPSELATRLTAPPCKVDHLVGQQSNGAMKRN